MRSILARVGAHDIRTDPFPHLATGEALPAAEYDALSQSFPQLTRVARGAPIQNNKLYLLSAHEVLEDTTIEQTWRDFFAYHVSAAFWAEAVTLLGTLIRRTHPDLEKRLGRPLAAMSVSMRRPGAEPKTDLVLDCQFAVNSPVDRSSSVRTPHLDNPHQLLNALLYCRAPDDDTPGGALELYRWRRRPGFLKRRTAMPTRIARVEIIPYEANRLVLFVNSLESVHGVSPRPITPHCRRYINVLCQLRIPLFETPRVAAPLRVAELALARLTGGRLKRPVDPRVGS